MNTISSASTAHFSNVWVNLATFDRREEAAGLNQCLRGEELIRKCRMSENFKSGGFWCGHEQGFMYECRNHRLVLRRTTRMLNRPPWDSLIKPFTVLPAIRFECISPKMTRKNILPTFVTQILVLLRLMRQEYYCETCHQSWPPK